MKLIRYLTRKEADIVGEAENHDSG